VLQPVAAAAKNTAQANTIAVLVLIIALPD
jgi:hypothetical protein